MHRSDQDLRDRTRRIAVGPLLVGMVGLLLIALALLATMSASPVMPSIVVALICCAWGAGLASAVLVIRLRLLQEQDLLAPAIGYGAMAALMTWSGRLLPGFSAATGPFDTSSAIELALLAVASPALLVLVQVLTARSVHLWLTAAGIALLGVIMTRTEVVSSSPDDLPVFLATSLTVVLVSLSGAATWLLQRGRNPGDAQGWIGVGLVLSAFVVVLAMYEMTQGRGISFALIGMMVALTILPFGLLKSFCATLMHRRDLDEQFTDRIVAGLLEGFETEQVDEAHMAEVESVLASRTLTTVLQPIVRLSDGRVEDMESLARFPNITPDQAFAAAATLGREVELELLAAEAALERLSELPSEVGLAVNIGPEALADPRFHALVLACPDPGRIVVELTEHRMIPRLDEVRAAIDRLRALGACIAVDDVGSGFTGLQVLANLRPDFVKLDRSLTSRLDEDPLTRALVEGILTYADRSGALVIAEGIEDAYGAALLRDLGVQRGQGWHFGRPGNAREAVLPSHPAVGGLPSRTGAASVD